MNKILHSNRTNKDKLPGQAKKSIFKGDILFSEIRPINKRFAYIDFDSQDYVVSTKFMIIKSNEKVFPLFLFYVLTSDKYMREFQYIAESRSGTFPQITFDSIKNIELKLFKKNNQLKIASAITAYDKLIENNTRRIEILEEMAQRIYKEWFINKDFEEISILEIPYFTFLKQNIKKFEGSKRYYATADVEGTNFIKNGIDYEYKNKPSRAQKQPLINSVWFARMKDSYKIAAFTKVNVFQAENSILSSGFAGFSSKYIHFGFLYLTISSKYFDNFKNIYATGSTQVSLNNDGLSKIYVPYPNEEKVLEFCNIVNPIIDKSILLKNINKNLIKTRDYLLSKLISGKVDVSDLDIDTSILDE